MRTDFNKEKLNIKSAAILFGLSLVMAIVTSVLGPGNLAMALIPMAICAGALAALTYFHCDSFRYLKIIAPICVIAVDWVFNGFFSICGIIVVVTSLMIFLVYEQGWSKLESALGMSLIIAVMIALVFVIIGVSNKEGLSLTEFYTKLYDEIKVEYVAYMTQIYETVYAGTDTKLPQEADIIYIFDYAIGMIVSFIYIFAFALVGVACKVFSFFMKKLSGLKERIAEWRFMPNQVYAYFYAGIEIIGLFIKSDLSALSLSIVNLGNIFMVIFAYVGLSAIGRMIQERKKRGMSVALYYVCSIGLAIVFPRVLSFLGVFYCIAASKFQNMRNDNDENS